MGMSSSSDSNANRCRRVHGVIVLIGLIFCILQANPVQAVDSGKLIEKDGQYVFVESMDPATRLLLERSYEKGIITQEERDKAIKESETRAYLMQPSFKLWYDRGFNFSMNDNAFLLKIRGRMQLRETTRWRNDAWRNLRRCQRIFRNYWVSSATTVPTVRMILPRNSIYDGLGCCSSGTSSVQTSSTFFRLGLKPPRMRRRRDPPILLDYYVLSTHFPLFNVQLGQYKVFFNRSQINNTASMQFAERALVMDAFTASGLNRRDIGITIMNDDEIYPVNYYLGIFNGAGPLFNRYGTYNSEEATVGCPGGQTGGNPFPFSRRMSSQFAQSQCECSRRDRQADVCRPAPVEYSGTTGIWRRRFGLFRNAANGGGWRTWPITPESIRAPTMRLSASIWRI